MIRNIIYLDDSKLVSYGSQLLNSRNKLFNKDVALNSVKVNTHNEQESIKSLLTKQCLALIHVLASANETVAIALDGDLETILSKNKQVPPREPRILDHQKITALVNALEEQNQLIDLDSFTDQDWENEIAVESLKPGDFIQLTCQIQFQDMAYFKQLAQAYRNYLSLAELIAWSKELQARKEATLISFEKYKKGETTPARACYKARRALLGEEPFQLLTILDFFEELSENALNSIPCQIIASPKSSSARKPKFIAPIKPEFLNDSKEELLLKYGHSPNQDWKLLGQVCHIPNKTTEEPKDIFNVDKVDNFADFIAEATNSLVALNQKAGTHMSITYPNISLNLITLYK